MNPRLCRCCFMLRESKKFFQLIGITWNTILLGLHSIHLDQRTNKQKPRINNPTTQKKKTRKYRQLKYGEQIPEKQTRNSSTKFNQLNQEEKSNSNNQYNTRRTYAVALRTTKQQNQIQQQNQTEQKPNNTMKF